MEDLIIKILFAGAMLLGVAGSILPVLPGAPLAFGSLLLARIFNFSELSWWVIGLFGVLTIIGIILDYTVPIATTKKMGGSKYGIWGFDNWFYHRSFIFTFRIYKHPHCTFFGRLDRRINLRSS